MSRIFLNPYSPISDIFRESLYLETIILKITETAQENNVMFFTKIMSCIFVISAIVLRFCCLSTKDYKKRRRYKRTMFPNKSKVCFKKGLPNFKIQ